MLAGLAPTTSYSSCAPPPNPRPRPLLPAPSWYCLAMFSARRESRQAAKEAVDSLIDIAAGVLYEKQVLAPKIVPFSVASVLHDVFAIVNSATPCTEPMLEAPVAAWTLPPEAPAPALDACARNAAPTRKSGAVQLQGARAGSAESGMRGASAGSGLATAGGALGAGQPASQAAPGKPRHGRPPKSRRDGRRPSAGAASAGQAGAAGGGAAGPGSSSGADASAPAGSRVLPHDADALQAEAALAAELDAAARPTSAAGGVLVARPAADTMSATRDRVLAAHARRAAATEAAQAEQHSKADSAAKDLRAAVASLKGRKFTYDDHGRIVPLVPVPAGPAGHAQGVQVRAAVRRPDGAAGPHAESPAPLATAQAGSQKSKRAGSSMSAAPAPLLPRKTAATETDDPYFEPAQDCVPLVTEVLDAPLAHGVTLKEAGKVVRGKQAADDASKLSMAAYAALRDQLAAEAAQAPSQQHPPTEASDELQATANAAVPPADSTELGSAAAPGTAPASSSAQQQQQQFHAKSAGPSGPSSRLTADDSMAVHSPRQPTASREGRPRRTPSASSLTQRRGAAAGPAQPARRPRKQPVPAASSQTDRLPARAAALLGSTARTELVHDGAAVQVARRSDLLPDAGQTRLQSRGDSLYAAQGLAAMHKRDRSPARRTKAAALAAAYAEEAAAVPASTATRTQLRKLAAASSDRQGLSPVMIEAAAGVLPAEALDRRARRSAGLMTAGASMMGPGGRRSRSSRMRETVTVSDNAAKWLS